MSKLTQLALASYEMEKKGGLLPGDILKPLGTAAAAAGIYGAGKYIAKKHAEGPKPGEESIGRKIGRGASTAVGATAGGVGGMLAGIALPKHRLLTGKTGGKLQTALAVGGGVAGAIGGGILGHKAVREKKAGLLDIAKGIGSVGLNLAKQNPGVTKVIAGGAAAGVAGAVAKKVLSPGQEKQADDKEYGPVRHVRDLALTGLSGVAGRFVGGDIASMTSPHNNLVGHVGTNNPVRHAGRVGFGKGMGLAAGVAIGALNAGRRKENFEKASAALLNAKKKSGDTEKETNDGKQETGTKSSLIAAANEQMAKEH